MTIPALWKALLKGDEIGNYTLLNTETGKYLCLDNKNAKDGVVPIPFSPVGPLPSNLIWNLRMDAEMKELFAEWYDAYMRYRKSRFDPAEYDKWRYRYPFYNPQFEDEDDYRKFMQHRQEVASWNLWCKCVKQPAEGIFEAEKMYLAKMITASNPQDYHGQTVDEGFFVLDGDDVILHFSMTDFPAFFKVE